MTNARWLAQVLPGWKYGDKQRDFLRKISDCWGFVIYVERTIFGREVPDYLADYDTATETHEVFLREKEKSGWARVEVPETGDVVLAHYHGRIHAGVYCGPGRMVHLSASGAAVTRVAAHRVEGYYRYAAA